LTAVTINFRPSNRSSEFIASHTPGIPFGKRALDALVTDEQFNLWRVEEK